MAGYECRGGTLYKDDSKGDKNSSHSRIAKVSQELHSDTTFDYFGLTS